MAKNVDVINSRLRPRPERPDPRALRSNSGCNFVGSYVLGMGFVLTPDERRDLIRNSAKNRQRIFPYLGGEEVNTSPTQSHHRYVINFGAMSLEEAEAWPELLEILRTKVKPERDRLKDNPDGRGRKKHWWQFARYTPALEQAIAPLPRCLVTARVSKHLMFSFQPTDRVLSEATYVFPLESASAFAILQSRVHEPWARLLSSSMGDTLRYAASDCFDTFPFPKPDPKTIHPKLERIGEKLYEARAAYMTDNELGLTQTYNKLKNPACDDAPIHTLRTLHEDLDRAVLTTYGWSDLDVPSFHIVDENFSEEVVDRLFVLNEVRSATQEVFEKD